MLDQGCSLFWQADSWAELLSFLLAANFAARSFWGPIAKMPDRYWAGSASERLSTQSGTSTRWACTVWPCSTPTGTSMVRPAHRHHRGRAIEEPCLDTLECWESSQILRAYLFQPSPSSQLQTIADTRLMPTHESALHPPTFWPRASAPRFQSTSKLQFEHLESIYGTSQCRLLQARQSSLENCTFVEAMK